MAARKDVLVAVDEAEVEGMDATLEATVSEEDVFRFRAEQMQDAPVEVEDRLLSVDVRGEFTVFTFARATLRPVIPEEYREGGPMPGYESGSTVLQYSARFSPGSEAWRDGRGSRPDFLTNVE